MEIDNETQELIRRYKHALAKELPLNLLGDILTLDEFKTVVLDAIRNHKLISIEA